MRIKLFPALILLCFMMVIVRGSHIVTSYLGIEDIDFLKSASNIIVSELSAKEDDEEVKEEENEAYLEQNDDFVSPILPEQDTRSFTKQQLDLLDSLSARRLELDNWERNIRMKENVLRAIELRIESKMVELRDLESRVKSLLEAYNEREDMKIKSLVKIYENMKPKEAARIFEELDMSVMLQVVNQMKEARVAPILAEVDPKLAKEITLQYAREKRLNQDGQPQRR